MLTAELASAQPQNAARLAWAQHGPLAQQLPSFSRGCTRLFRAQHMTTSVTYKTVARRSSAYDHPALYTCDDTFAEPSYWDRCYRQKPQPFEWYSNYERLRPLLLRYLPPQLPILQVGMGTSQIQADMVTQDGYTSIMNVDYSPVAVTQQREEHAHMPQLKYGVADARCLGPAFPDAAFAGVLDKGTLDALLCGEDDVQDSRSMVEEAWRVLEPGGVYMQITKAPPASRLRYLSCTAGWGSVEVWEVGCQGKYTGPYKVDLPPAGSKLGCGTDAHIPVHDNSCHWVYACRKRVELCGLRAVEL